MRCQAGEIRAEANAVAFRVCHRQESVADQRSLDVRPMAASRRPVHAAARVSSARGREHKPWVHQVDSRVRRHDRHVPPSAQGCCQSVATDPSCPVVRRWFQYPDLRARLFPQDVPTAERPANDSIPALVAFRRIAERKTAVTTDSLRGIGRDVPARSVGQAGLQEVAANQRKMRPGRFELPRSKRTTRPSTLRVYQFRHRRVAA